MRNFRGELAECTTSNLFVVEGGVVFTPPLDAGLLPGITREFVFELGKRANISVVEATLRDDDLLAADKAFLTSTTREIVPIVSVDSATIGIGVPGPITQSLLLAFRREARGFG
jgi:branched-subunit amino acid aminotransferase/4-amino-4-deoxychorismate lyase